MKPAKIGDRMKVLNRKRRRFGWVGTVVGFEGSKIRMEFTELPRHGHASESLYYRVEVRAVYENRSENG